MYGRALTDEDIERIGKASKEELSQMSITAFTSLNPRQKRYCEEYITSKHERTASMSAGYTDTGIAEQLVRLRKNLNVCLYISCKEELEKREQEALLHTEDDNIDTMKQVCKSIYEDEDANNSDRLKAIEQYAKLVGIYKDATKAGKNRTFGIKKSEKLREVEQTGVKQSKSGIKPQRINDMEFDDD
jgi:phage terminase small subunit